MTARSWPEPVRATVPLGYALPCCSLYPEPPPHRPCKHHGRTKSPALLRAQNACSGENIQTIMCSTYMILVQGWPHDSRVTGSSVRMAGELAAGAMGTFLGGGNVLWVDLGDTPGQTGKLSRGPSAFYHMSAISTVP